MSSSLRQTTSDARLENRWEAFEAEAMPHMDSLFRIAMWRAHDRAAAEDIVQETLMEALRSFHRYEAGTNCRAWLVTIMHHMLSKQWRKDARLQLVADEDERISETIAYEAPMPQGLSDDEVLGALRRIPPSYSQVVLLADVEEMAYKEIAAALQVPIGTVMSRLNRGRKLLRTELAAYAHAHGIGDDRERTPPRR
ncbi:MAG: sigma-70 family RNA polymerase sigma factor [Pyrinomonadaceae bacterium]|nr:sigma-70 family RNA polymerase sigma factor [Pyrinomonadaceae bacterium]